MLKRFNIPDFFLNFLCQLKIISYLCIEVKTKGDMIEAKLRVEMLENRVGSKNPFYGSTMVKKVVEDILLHDKDTRNDIAPYGIYATIAINSKVVLGEGDKPLETKKVFDIKVSKHYLDHEGEGRYLAFFQIEEKTYEIFVHFDEKNRIDTITLSEWLNEGYYEDCDDADNIYRIEDFTTFGVLEC